MVFESMLVDILNRYLRPYVKKLDPSQMKLGVWKGHAQLEKLELKEDVFEEADLDIPVKITNSYIGKLDLRIPWKRLTKDPIYVTIDEVYVVLGPKVDTHYDAEKDLKRRRKEKEKAIKKFEDAAKKKKKKEKETKKGKKKTKDKSTDKPDTFTEKLVTNLLKNMEVKIRDVHVRYEDSTSSGHSRLAAGVTLHSLELKSTDENWKPSFVKETAVIIFKLLELNCLGLYWNTFTTAMASLPQQQMVNEMRETIARPVLPPPPTIEYLLKPLSASAQLKLSLRPGVDMDTPQAAVDVHLDDIVVTLQEGQFKSIMNTVEIFDRHVVNLKYLKYRPEVGVREGTREWWNYAIAAVTEEEVKRKLEMWSWKHIQQHRLTFKRYRDKYREKLKSLSPSLSLLQEIQELEDQLNWFNIVIARREAKKDRSRQKRTSVAMSTITKSPSPLVTPSPMATQAQHPPPPAVEKSSSSSSEFHPVKKKDEKVAGKKEAKEPKKKKGLFANFRKKLKSGAKSEEVKGVYVKGDEGSGEMGKGEGASGGGGSASATVPEQKGVISDEEKEEQERQEFYKAIGYSEEEEYTEYPKEYVAHKILVNLNSVTVELTGKKRLATLITNRVMASVRNRPSSKSVSVAASVAGLEMQGIPHTGPDPTIILSTATSDLKNPLVNLQLELNPLDSDFDMDLKASLQPLQITYDADTIDGLIAAFRIRKHIHLQELAGAASATVKDLQTQTSAGFKYALQSKKQMRLDVKLHSPYLVLSQGGYLSPRSSLLVVDLGTLSICGNTRGQVKDRCELNTGDQLSHFYDNFTLKLEGMQVMVANPGDDWQVAMSQGKSPLHILEPTGLQLQLKQSIVKKDAYLPSIRIEGDIPGFDVNVSDEKLVTILNIVTSLQLPPPSLANTTTYYDDIPAPTIARTASLSGMADDIMDTMSLSSYMVEEEEEEEDEDEGETCSISPSVSSEGDSEKDVTAIERIYTDAEIKLVIRKIAVGFTQVVRKGDPRTSKVKPTHRKLLDIRVEEMRADIIDRSWDSQGSVTIGNVSILDYISLDSSGSPTVLLKTRGLSDGNFITAKYITVTRVGKAFAEKYTGFKNSVSAQLSLVELRLERGTIATLLEMGMDLKPAMMKSALPAEEVDSPKPTSIVASTPTPPGEAVPTINPNDFDDVGPKKSKDFHFSVNFEGIALHVAHQRLAVAYAKVSGFSVKGQTEAESLSVTASMEDVLVEDPQSSQDNMIVSRTDPDKKMIELEVTEYKHTPQERDPVNLGWVDTELKAQIQRIKVQLDTGFLNRVLNFAQYLKINQDALKMAAKATADTATAAATAIRESEKTAHRVKLDISLHAPLILLPYSMKTTRGQFTVDLGDFHVQNRFVYGESLLASPLDTIREKSGKTTFDLIEIRSTAIQIRRSSSHIRSSGQESVDSLTILEPMHFTATVTRNLGNPMLALPNIEVKLPLNIVKFHLHEGDVKALITIALATTKVAQVLSPQQSSPDIMKGKPELPVSKPHSKSTSHSHTFVRMDSVVEVKKVRVETSLVSVSLDFATRSGPLFSAFSSGLKGELTMYKEMVKVEASVDSMSVTDSSDDKLRKIVSLAEDTDKVSSLKLKLDTTGERDPLQPLGEIKTRIAQVRLMLTAPFIRQLLEFVQRLKGVNTEMVANAAKLSKGGAQAITSKAWDKYLTIDVSAHAPVLILPVSEVSPQAFMIDLGSVTINNVLLPLDEGAGIEAYGINLNSLKASRVLLDMEEDYRVLCERVLFQPFHIQLAAERNLCSAWYSKRPTIYLNCQMGEFKLLVGQEDLIQLVTLGRNFADSLSTALDKGSGGGEVREAIMEGLTAGGEEEEGKEEEKKGEVTEMVKVTASLNVFELKLFKEEPSLSTENPDSSVVTDSFALASMKLLQMDLSLSVQSNKEVELQTSLKDITLYDEQPQEQDKKTGTRVIQHYTSNPLMAYSGKLDSPLIKLSYFLREGQHFVFLKAENILVLTDIQFLTTLSNHFQAVLPKKETDISPPPSSVEDSILSGISSPEEERSLAPPRTPKPLPRLKVEANISGVRVAIVEDVDNPQALTLKVKNAYLNVQLTEKNKLASANISELSIAASSFFNLEEVNKWILLPCSMQLTASGPLDKPAMDVSGTVEAISLTLSPSVIRLIIHALTSLIPKKETQKQPAPLDLWEKKRIEGQRFWFFKPVPLYKGRTETVTETVKKGEILCLVVQSVEVILENEGSQSTRGYPVLACNVTAVVKVLEWTGDLTVDADVHCEASYYNEKLSVWEPLLEPLEDRETGRMEAWCLNAKVQKCSPKNLPLSEDDSESTEANFSASLSAESPLQLTLTKTSLELLKSLAKAYTKEYERKLEISADVESLTGAPFTVINKLGGAAGVFIQPGKTLKLREKALIKLEMNGMADLWFVKVSSRHKSYASLLIRPGEEEHTVNLAIGSFKNLKDVVISNPGCFYFPLELKQPTAQPVHYGVVVDVAVTGTKKTVTIRSPVQFHNHLKVDVELLSAPEMSRDKRSQVTVVAPGDCYAVPIELAQRHVFYVVPAGFGLEPMGPHIAWFDRPGGKYVDSRCKVQGESVSCHFIRVVIEEEKYGLRKNLPTEDFGHHIFHLHPPLLLQNLLPFTITAGNVNSGCPMTLIKPGEFVHYHEITPDLEPSITISVSQPSGNSLMGKLKLLKDPKKYSKISTSTDGMTVVVSALTENLGYHKVSLFSPYWMINKTGLDIDYLVDGKAIKHPTNKSLVLLSTSNPKNDVQLRALTPHGKYTDWTFKFSLSGVGTSGNFIARLGMKTYIFGVAVHLSQFTLTKIVTISPYYMLVNETEALLKVAEATTPHDKIYLPPEELVPFWPLSDDSRMVVTVGNDETPVVFNYRKADTVCLKFENELKAVCVDVQESESAIITNFTPYYPGCVPVQIINHFPDIGIKFCQESKSVQTPVHILNPGECMFYTWDKPLERKVLRWGLSGATVKEAKPIRVNKDDHQTFHIRYRMDSSPSVSSSYMSPGTPAPVPGMADSWLDVDESFSERLITADDSSSETSSISSFSSLTSRGTVTSSLGGANTTDGGGHSSRAYWKSFINGIQRVVLFTPFIETIDRIKAVASFTRPQLEVSLALKTVGLSLVDNYNKRELAYIAVTQSGVIWQVEKARKRWKTLNNSLIAVLEDAHQKKEIDIKLKDISVNLATMEMFSPVRGKLRRTHHDGVYTKFTMSERDYSISAKVGYVQVDNQLPFSVYPQVLYPLPPPPTVASTTEPKPFVEASIILRKKDDQSNVQHFKYVHVLVQKMAVNADLGFLLAVVTFFSKGQSNPQLEAEYLQSDIEETKKSLKDTIVPAISKDLEYTKSFFDVLHIAPIKIVLSFNVRSVGKNKEGENKVGDRVLELFLHSLGAILTSVQDTEMKFSLFHMEYQMKTGRALVTRLVKHYRTQALVELYTLVLGLDVLGNPVNVVKGVVGGTIDLFYEPIKGSVLGPEEFLEGLGIGLRSFVGGTVGGLTGAGAKITGAVGDVFAKLTFDEQFQDKRQQQKTRPPKLGSKFGGFAKNVFEGVTGVVAQPVKGAQKEGATGLFKGVGKGLVGLVVRPTGGLVDLASGTLDFVTRKTQVGNFEIKDIRQPRFIGRDGVVRPFSPSKAIGTALLHAVDEGKYVDQFYYSHVELSKKQIVLVLDRSLMLIEKHVLRDVLGDGGWHSQGCVRFKHFRSPVTVRDTNVILNYKPGEEKDLLYITVNSEQKAHEVADVINQSYTLFQKEF